MSRIAKSPVPLLSGVDVKLSGQSISVKGPKGTLEFTIHPQVKVVEEDATLKVSPQQESRQAWAMAGTTRALISNMITGVSKGFERKLALVGIGYRAQAKGRVLNLTLGYSHPIEYKVPDGTEVNTPSPTEIVVSGYDKQKVGQVAAEIRGFRPPEPYKGKGIRYADEAVVRKEAKKK